jgi:preprotein translocase subunit SecD
MKNWRVRLVFVVLILSILLVCNIIPINKFRGGEAVGIGFGNGLDYGLDFGGGTEIQLRLEDPVNGTMTADVLEVEKNILERRLNSMGLRDIPVRPWGDRYIVIQVASASPEDIAAIENILQQQARFESRINGEVAVTGSEVSIDLGPSGSGVLPSGPPYEWYVSIKLTRSGGERFCAVGGDKRNQPIDMFLDRPENTIIVMNNATYSMLSDVVETEDDPTSDNYVRIIENRSDIPILVVENSTLDAAKLANYSGYTHVIIAASEEQVSEVVRNQLEELGYTTERNPQNGVDLVEWATDIIGLKSSPRLRCDPCSTCKYSAQISGAADTFAAAKAERDENRILLSSGNLPAEAVVESKSQFPASVGEKFLEYSFIIGLISLVTVALVIYLRYREVNIVLPTMFTGLSEIIITLGVAALLNWEMDLPGVAGIIAAVGTGVNDQIIINDEALKKRKEEDKDTNIFAQIRRAFFIIFTAAATIVAVMVPLFSIQALKGFAFMTIIGVFIGVFLTRPVYAKFVEAVREGK